MQQDAWIAKAEKELQTLQVAIESYYRNNNQYPESLSDLVNASPRIITKLLEDPWKTNTVGDTNTYGYYRGEVNGFGTFYVVYSKSIDSVDSTINTWPVNLTDPAEMSINGDDIVLTNLPVVES